VFYKLKHPGSAPNKVGLQRPAEYCSADICGVAAVHCSVGRGSWNSGRSFSGRCGSALHFGNCRVGLRTVGLQLASFVEGLRWAVFCFSVNLKVGATSSGCPR